jgi:hypothetical protein
MMLNPMVSITRNQFIAALVGVCVLSAAIGSGVTLLAKTGPSGAAGERGAPGPEGPEGPEGASGAEELGLLESEVEELRGQAEGGEELEGRLNELESEISGLSATASEICAEIEHFC